MKKILALLLVLALSLTLVACGSGKKDAASTGSYKVAMVTDYGDITDQSFNQTTWEAVVAFGKDNNVETKYYKPTSNDTAGRVASVELAIAEGYNVIVMPGYAFGGTIVEVAPNYPDVKFVALDVAKGDLLETAVANKGESYDYNPDNWKLEDYVDMSNVYCAIYQEELAGTWPVTLLSSWATPSWASWAAWPFPPLSAMAMAMCRALMPLPRSWASPLT